MNDRKWLNMVIFLISAMILLFLILQKKMEQAAPEQTLNKSYGILLDSSFGVERVILNGRWLPVEQLKKTLKPKQWTDFLTAWKTIQPEVVLSELPQPLKHAKKTELEWVSAKQKRSFKLYSLADGLLLQTNNANHNIIIYSYNSEQAQQLLPHWLTELNGIQ